MLGGIGGRALGMGVIETLEDIICAQARGKLTRTGMRKRVLKGGKVEGFAYFKKRLAYTACPFFYSKCDQARQDQKSFWAVQAYSITNPTEFRLSNSAQHDLMENQYQLLF